MASQTKSATISSNAAAWSEPVSIEDDYGMFDIYGTFAANVALQTKIAGEPDSEWHDIDTFSAPARKTFYSRGAWQYRVGCHAADWMSGVVNIRLVG